jgi:hypothetical protein
MSAGFSALLILGALANGGDLAHPQPLSRLVARVAPKEIYLELRIQEASLREVPRWWLDSDNDGHTATTELQAAWPEVAAYLQETTWFTLDAAQITPAWEIGGFDELADPLPGGGAWFEYLVVTAVLPRAADLNDFAIHSDLFIEDGNPRHRLLIAVEGIWDTPAEYVLGYAERDWSVTLPNRATTVLQYARLGFEHVLTGWDHLAFVMALLFGVAGLRSLVGAVTAFTLAHTLTLALAATGVLTLPKDVVEPLIAWSVLLVLLAHLRLGPAQARAWLPAFFFGLLHGFGFAGALGDIGLPHGARLTGLLGFNLGVEAGQLTVVLPIAALAFALRRLLTESWPALRRTAALVLLAFAIHLTGAAIRSWWFLEDLPGPEVWAVTLAGAAAAWFSAEALSVTVLRRGIADVPLRPILLQAVLLVIFYAVGASF